MKWLTRSPIYTYWQSPNTLGSNLYQQVKPSSYKLLKSVLIACPLRVCGVCACVCGVYVGCVCLWGGVSVCVCGQKCMRERPAPEPLWWCCSPGCCWARSSSCSCATRSRSTRRAAGSAWAAARSRCCCRCPRGSWAAASALWTRRCWWRCCQRKRSRLTSDSSQRQEGRGEERTDCSQDSEEQENTN